MSQAPAAPPRPGPRARQHRRQAQRCQDDDRHVDRGYPADVAAFRNVGACGQDQPAVTPPASARAGSCAVSSCPGGSASGTLSRSAAGCPPFAGRGPARSCLRREGTVRQRVLDRPGWPRTSPAHQRDAKEGLTGEGVSGQLPASAAAMQSWRLSILRGISWSGRVVFRWLAGSAVPRRRWDGTKARCLPAPPSALPDEPIPSLCGHRFQYLQGAADPGGFEREVK